MDKAISDDLQRTSALRREQLERLKQRRNTGKASDLTPDTPTVLLCLLQPIEVQVLSLQLEACTTLASVAVFNSSGLHHHDQSRSGFASVPPSLPVKVSPHAMTALPTSVQEVPAGSS